MDQRADHSLVRLDGDEIRSVFSPTADLEKKIIYNLPVLHARLMPT